MLKFNTHEAKTKLSELLEKAENGEVVYICRNGRPIAELRAISKRRDRLTIHPKLGKIRLTEDPSKPLSEEDWPEIVR